MKRFATIALATVALGAMSTTASASVASDLANTKWKTKGGKSIVQFSSNGKSASIKQILKGDKNAVSKKGAKKGQKIQGMTILWGLSSNGKSGKVFDPEGGKTYSGSVTLNGNKLKLKGCAAKVFCRSQTWTRVK